MRIFSLVALVLLFTPMLAQSETKWENSETFFVSKVLVQQEFTYGKYTKAPLDPTAENSGTFDLFYFLRKAYDPNQKTVLFIAGGPGRILGNRPTDLAELHDKFNVVYFHIRGGGASQIPKGKKFDKYLNSESVAYDIELIRQNLNLQYWDMVYSYSHGTLVAQVYGSLFPNSSKRMVYDAATTWYQYRNKQDPYFHTRINFTKTFELDAFGVLSDVSEKDKRYILEKLEAVITQLDGTSTTEILIKGFLEKDEFLLERPEFKDKSVEFVVALHQGKYMGWSTSNNVQTRLQRAATTEILKHYFPEKVNGDDLNWSNKVIHEERKKIIPELSDKDDTNSQKNFEFPGVSMRSFEVIANKEAFGEGGEIYSPKRYSHSIETIVFNGSSDGASPLEGAYEVYEEALEGKKILFLSNGLSHGAFFKGGESATEILESLILQDNFEILFKSLSSNASALPEGVKVEYNFQNKKCSQFFN